jgi:two-component system response regulator HydG
MPPRARDRTILVVDDEADNCSNLADILEDLGFLVDTASNGDTALEMVRSRPYDVVLLDLKMPGMDGLEVYRQIKKLRARTIAIVISAHPNTAKARQALASGAWKVLAKPVQVPVLIKLIEQAVEQPLILVVDDDRDLCQNLWELFREHGYRVDLALDEAEAVALLDDTRFHVVLIDLKLSSGDGAQLFRHVRTSSPTTRTILITGHRQETDTLVTKIINDGAQSVCFKPFDIPQLLRAIGLPSVEHPPAADSHADK